MQRGVNGGEIVASVDNHEPETLGLPHLSRNLKREQRNREALEKIEQENHRLLDHLKKLEVSSHASSSEDAPRKPKSLNISVRKREMATINAENKRMLQRIVERLKKGTMSEQLAEPATLQFSRSRKQRPGTTDPGNRTRTLSSTAKSRLSTSASTPGISPLAGARQLHRDKSRPVVLTPLDRARAAALAELKAAKGYDIVSQLIASESVLTQARRQALADKHASDGELDHSRASLPAGAPETEPDDATKGQKGIRRKKRAHKKPKAWKDHPFATPKEALISLNGGVYVPPTAATPERRRVKAPQPGGSRQKPDRPSSASAGSATNASEAGGWEVDDGEVETNHGPRHQRVSPTDKTSAFKVRTTSPKGKPHSARHQLSPLPVRPPSPIVVGADGQAIDPPAWPMQPPTPTSGLVLMVDVEREFACGRGNFNVIMDANAELPTMHAIGDCVLTKRGKVVPIRCGITAAQLEESVSPIMLSLRSWEILSRCGVFPPGHTWLPNLTDVRIQSVSGASIPVTLMALAESFADNLVDVTTTNGDSVHHWFVYEEPDSVKVGRQLTKINGEYLMINCAIVQSSDVSTWLPDAAYSTAANKPVSVFIASVFRSRDSSNGTLVIGPDTFAALPLVAAGLGVVVSRHASDGLEHGRRISDALLALKSSPSAVWALLRSYVSCVHSDFGLQMSVVFPSSL